MRHHRNHYSSYFSFYRTSLDFGFVVSSSASASTIPFASATLGFFSGQISLYTTTVVVFCFYASVGWWLLIGRAGQLWPWRWRWYFFDRAFVVVLVVRVDGGSASVGLFITVGTKNERGAIVEWLCYRFRRCRLCRRWRLKVGEWTDCHVSRWLSQGDKMPSRRRPCVIWVRR